MPKIGKALFVPHTVSFRLKITKGEDEYVLDNTASPSSVENVYDYVKSDRGWYVALYADCTIVFERLGCFLDICAVGGGGGGGGGYGSGSGYYNVKIHNGGYGGGGRVVTITRTKAMLAGTPYDVTIGAGGSAGAATNNRGEGGQDGGAGGATSISNSIITADGGGGGQLGKSWVDGDNGAGDNRQYAFGDTTFPEVSGLGSETIKGSGGIHGTAWHDGEGSGRAPGKVGVKGCLIIRSHL